METAMQSSARRKRALSDDRLDSILRALSDRTRRQLLVRLASGPAMVSELAEPFAMSRVAISKHLRVLEQAWREVASPAFPEGAACGPDGCD